jgi:hypothetical protein
MPVKNCQYCHVSAVPKKETFKSEDMNRGASGCWLSRGAALRGGAVRGSRSRRASSGFYANRMTSVMRWWSSCGTVLPCGSRFCYGCGTALTAEAGALVRSTSPESYIPKHLAEKILTAKSSLEGERMQIRTMATTCASSPRPPFTRPSS